MFRNSTRSELRSLIDIRIQILSKGYVCNRYSRGQVLTIESKLPEKMCSCFVDLFRLNVFSIIMNGLLQTVIVAPLNTILFNQ